MHRTKKGKIMKSSKISLVIFIVMFIVLGTLHFITPEAYLSIMPEYLPSKPLLVLLSGIAEICIGLIFLFSKYRKLGAILCILMLLSFMPIHIYHLQLGTIPKTNVPFWGVVVRIPLQFVMMWWAWSLRKVK
jgi:uncharacterized membrane protein